MTSISDVDAIVKIAGRLTVRRLYISSSVTREVYSLIHRIWHTLDSYSPFQAVLKPFRHYAFQLPTSPLPLNSPEFFPLAALEEFLRSQDAIISNHSDIASAIHDLGTKLITLSRIGESPFLEEILKDMQLGNLDQFKVAILVMDNRTISSLTQHVPLINGNTKIITPSSLKSLDTYHCIYVCGPLSLYPHHIWRAPRAAHIRPVQYDWCYEQDPPNTHFRNPLTLGKDPSVPRKDWLKIHNSDLQAKISHKWVQERYRASDVDEPVEAWLVPFANGKGVFVREDVFTVDPTEVGDSRLRRTPVEELTEESFVVVRTATAKGKDYVAHLADQILGERSSTLRRDLSNWKVRLRELSKTRGYDYLANQLSAKGAEYSDAYNLRNWASSYVIGPKSKNDFRLLLDLLGVKETQHYIDGLVDIRKAHNRAKHLNRANLIAAIKDADLTGLDTIGSITIQLDDIDAGTLSIFRIGQLKPVKETIAYRYLGDIIDLEPTET